jgi:P27 family predicted phage terminase small subunit
VIHQLHGTFRTTRHRSRASEPVAPGQLEEPPEDLTEKERESWHFAVENAPRGVLRTIDRDLLALWVKTRSRYDRAEAAQAKLNASLPMPDIIRTPSGAFIQSPYVGMMNRTALLLVRLAEQLGFTPTSRPRLAGEQEGSGDDEGRWLEVMSLARRPSNQA